MSMTREEAITYLQEKYDYCKSFYDLAAHPEEDYPEMTKYLQALQISLSALRPITREQVERIRGEWVAKHRHRGGFRRVTGVDDMGEQRTITIDERCEYDDRYCSKCGKQSPDNFLNFCGYCGTPMTDEAVQMVMERINKMEETGDGLG